jgi:polysaccharide biosynthesis protein PslG
MSRAPALTIAAIALALVPATAGGAPPKRFFGISQGLADVDGKDANIMAAGGVGSVRFLLYWGNTEPAPADYKWAATDDLVGRIASRGMQPLPFIFGSPPWVTGNESRPPIDNAHDLDAWKAFLAAAVARYGPGGDYWAGPYQAAYGAGASVVPIVIWQPWNEPNLKHYFLPRPSPRRFATLLRISADAIRSEEPEATIVLPGMPGFAHPYAWDFLRRLYRIKGSKGDFDAVALHPYARNMHQIKVAIRRMRQVMKARGDRRTPLWITEMGWGSAAPDGAFNVGLRGQKRMLKRSFRLILHRRKLWRIQRVYWFDWRDPAGPSGPVTCSFCISAGLFKHDRTAKPAWQAYKRFALP